MQRVRLPRAATLLAVIAVVLAAGGTAVAAQHYLITSTKQISPKVRAALRGKTGGRGRTGARGPAGTDGRNGTNGTNGVNGTNGHDGARGPSDVHVSFFNGPNAIPANSTNFQAVIDNLAPYGAGGPYAAVAKLSITPTGTGEVSCTLLSFSGTSLGSDTSYAKGDGVEQTLTMMIPADFSSPTAGSFGFGVFCNTPAGTSASYQQAKITAIATADATIAGG